MKKLLLLSCFSICSAVVFGQSNTAISLMPQPASLVEGQGRFDLPSDWTISVPADPQTRLSAERFAKKVTQATGKNVHVSDASAASIAKALVINKVSSINKEGYRLVVSPAGIQLSSSDAAGAYYGLQTLLQLLPKEIEGSTSIAGIDWSIPSVTIEDQPRFGWRGLMLDVSRHFFTKEEVKRYIDQMSRYKFNLLHWHLTDDQGWRIEIKSYPKLTSVGAWRVDKTGSFNTFSKPTPDEPRNYGGFYTQDDIREIVAYAAERFVNILPEVDVPGHSLAAIAAYPELTCTPGTYAVNSGEPFMVWPPSGHFYGLLDNSLCPANEKVYTFMDKVFGEIAGLFPFSYIHMGGDETARNFWEKSAAIKAMMQKEKLKNLDEVQSYFVKRMEKIINSKGKKMIGWDEILQGGLAPNAAVMSWRGMNGGIEAAKQGHEVVMSPTDFVYLDYMQSDKVMEPPVYASLRLKKTYEFEPQPEGIKAELVKGGQGNLWTEQVYNMRQVEYMTWPRGFAIADILWSPRNSKNWAGFIPRVEKQFERLDIAKVKYAPSMYDPDFKFSKQDSDRIVVELKPEIDGLEIHYSFDNSFPDEYYPIYSKPLLVPKDAFQMKLISYRNGKPIGRMIIMTVDEMRKRVK